MKRNKRKLVVVNSITAATLMDLAEAHTAALLILSHIEAPPEAKPYLNKAIGLFSNSLKDINAQYLEKTGSILVTQHVVNAFAGPSDENKAEAVAG